MQQRPTHTTESGLRSPTPRRADWKGRLLAAGAASGLLGVLLLAASLSPASEGHGTHTDLGLPACGWVAAMNKPCPSCGMTTAFSHAADGALPAAFATQPFGAFLALVAAASFWGSLHVALTGSQVGRMALRLVQPRTLICLGALAAAAWGYKFLTWGG